MTPEQMAKEFCEGAFGPFNVELAPYVAIVKELIEKAQDAERERCSRIVERARFGEIDTDFRSIIHRIDSQLPADFD